MTGKSLVPRRWWARGHADHGWLKSFHTFSFANYFDPSYMSFGPLRVINEDRVAPGTGFPTHPHANAEIFSYIINGELTHRDSMSNVETLRRGEVQFTSAGTGIRHSEYNAHKQDECHFLQIWYTPSEKNLKPKYYTLPQTSDDEKRDKLMTLIRSTKTFSKQELEKTGLLPQGRAIPAHCNLATSATILSAGEKATPLTYRVGSQSGDAKEGNERWIYLHVAMTSGYRDARLYQRDLALKMREGQSHEQRLKHAAEFLGGVYEGRKPFWSASGHELQTKEDEVKKSAKRPRVTLTFAQSLDGKIAGEGGKMLPLSGPESMIMTHALRTMHDGILIGVGTLLNDNPQLNARLLAPLPPSTSKSETVSVDQCPRPIILDSGLRTPLDCKLFQNSANGTGKAPLIVHNSSHASSEAAQKLKALGAQLIAVSDTRKWEEVLESISKETDLQSVMVEGGASIIQSLLVEEHLVDTVIVTVSRKDVVGDKGLGYGAAPSWLHFGNLPSGASKKPTTTKESQDAGKAMSPITLTPEPFGKDLVFAWSRSVAHSAPTARVQVKLSSVDREETLEEGDGLYIRGARIGKDEVVLTNVGSRDAELLLFDVEPGEEEDDDDDDY